MLGGADVGGSERVRGEVVKCIHVYIAECLEMSTQSRPVQPGHLLLRDILFCSLFVIIPTCSL